ncbi:ATP-binding protein [Candidatus Saccharibacteria bacterium]|nr:ATP-binding protein [Candidatus Saccharibacteria bacterium]
MEILRTQYLEKLRAVKDKRLIKVITGMRRVGKSTLLRQFRDEILSSGVSQKRTQFYNFEEKSSGAYEEDWQKIHDKIEANLAKAEMNYIFLDEIQNINEWEKMVDSLYVKPNVDLYITGSNAYFLSSELSTLLSGRQFEVRMLPFSYKEYTKQIKDDNDSRLMQYLRYGGMPQAVDFLPDENLVVEYLEGVYNTVVLKDIMARVGNSEMLTRVMSYAFDNIGNGFSAKKVADYLCNNYRRVSSDTVEQYLKAALEAFILYPAQRFNIRGKELLKTQKKYYLVDTGLRNVLIARGEAFDIGRALENVVYLELLRRGCQVFVGQTKSGKEVDFVAKYSSGEIKYYQICETMRSEDTRARELASLREIDDNYPKMVLSLDQEENSFDGIRQTNLRRWLSSE